MKAVTWQGTGKVQVEDVPEPRIRERTDAVVRITSRGGTCWMCSRGFQAQFGPIKVPEGPSGERFLFLTDVIPMPGRRCGMPT